MQRRKAKEEFGRGSTRRSILDKELAMNRAYNPSESKFGGALLKGNSQESRLLNSELSKLENQLRRQRMHIDQEKKQFLARRSLPDPILIVERPPSPEVIRKQLYTSDPDYFDDSREPNYMRPTQARARTPSTIPSIDAYSVKTKKKKNLWEDAASNDQKPRFQSTARPSWPLTEAEQNVLARGWEVHVRPVKSAEALALSADPSNRHSPNCRNNPKTKKKKKREALPPPSGPTSDTSTDSTFITEIPKVRYSTEGLGMERPSKNVSFADEVGLYFDAKNDLENKKRPKKEAHEKEGQGRKEVASEAPKSSHRKQVLTESSKTNRSSDISKDASDRKKPISPFRRGTKSTDGPRSGTKTRTSKASLDPVSEDEM